MCLILADSWVALAPWGIGRLRQLNCWHFANFILFLGGGPTVFGGCFSRYSVGLPAFFDELFKLLRLVCVSEAMGRRGCVGCVGWAGKIARLKVYKCSISEGSFGAELGSLKNRKDCGFPSRPFWGSGPCRICFDLGKFSTLHRKICCP